MNLSRLSRQWGPLGLLGLSMVGAWALLRLEPTGQLQGYVDPPVVELRAPEAGQVAFLAADGAVLQSGDLAARLVSNEVAADLARAQVDESRGGRDAQTDATDARLATAELSARAAQAEGRAKAATAERAALLTRIEELKVLATQGLGNAEEAADLSARAASLAAEAKGHRTQAQVYRDALLPGDASPDLGDAAQARVAALQARMDALTLTAPLTGRVRRLTAATHVDQAEPLARLVPDQATRAVVCLSEGMTPLPAGQVVTVALHAADPMEPKRTVSAQVVDSDAPLEPTDTRCGGHPALPSWSRHVRLSLTEALPSGARLVVQP